VPVAAEGVVVIPAAALSAVVVATEAVPASKAVAVPAQAAASMAATAAAADSPAVHFPLLSLHHRTAKCVGHPVFHEQRVSTQLE
jgi:hypothetical protein